MTERSGPKTGFTTTASARPEKWPPFDGTIGEARYRYRTLPVEHLSLIQKDFSGLERQGLLSGNRQFRDYLERLNPAVPASFPEARSAIVVARTAWMAQVFFHYQGSRVPALLPPQYFDDGMTSDQMRQAIRRDVLGKGKYRLEKARGIPVKTLAVRCGLGRYGRNNLCYVDGMGSFSVLHCYFTDKRFAPAKLTEAKPLDLCRNCTACRELCPTGSIGEGRFVIDAGRCLSLYNEVEGRMPDWMPAASHHALVGCLRCQLQCPANQGIESGPRQFEDVAHDETAALLSGKIGREMADEVARKLHLFSGEYLQQALPVLSRNLRLLLHNPAVSQASSRRKEPWPAV